MKTNLEFFQGPFPSIKKKFEVWREQNPSFRIIQISTTHDIDTYSLVVLYDEADRVPDKLHS